MANEFIKCPECGAEFQISQAISHEIEITVAKKYEKQIKDLKEQSQKNIELKEKELGEQFAEEKKQIESNAKKKVVEAFGLEISDLKERIIEKDKKIKESQDVELNLRKRQRLLEKKERTLELEVARQLDSERQKIIDKALTDYDDKHRLKDAEKEKQMADMRRQIDELKRKAEQGSQQTQGEVLELQIEEMLRQEFPIDDIEPVPKGIKGADAVQVVKTQSGKICGKVLWESKRTKNWSDTWIQKAKDDQREAKAHLVVIVTETLPDGVTQFSHINGVWVVSILLALDLSRALRFMVLEVAREKSFQDGKTEKMEILYNYLTGPEFRNRLEAILEGFIALKKDLDSEKRAMEKIWSKREKQIDKVIKSIGGMHGDIEGIAGPSLPVLKMLELPSANNEEE
ncbi:DUF2130 domain-containing protein [candidate division WOR-3 bacterium]|nr:DUF2130 domain-containing protein [candidate division WOR-3 bacterium]